MQRLENCTLLIASHRSRSPLGITPSRWSFNVLVTQVRCHSYTAMVLSKYEMHFGHFGHFVLCFQAFSIFFLFYHSIHFWRFSYVRTIQTSFHDVLRDFHPTSWFSWLPCEAGVLKRWRLREVPPARVAVLSETLQTRKNSKVERDERWKRMEDI